MPDGSKRAPCPKCGGTKEPGIGRRLCEACLNAPTLRCCRCQVVKPREGFYRSSSKRTGRQTTCKECQDASRQLRALDVVHEADLRRKRYEVNTPAVRAYQRAWYATNAGSQRARVRNYRARNPEKVRAARLRYYRDNREAALARSRRYFREHPEWARAVKHNDRARRVAARIGAITPVAAAAKWAYWSGLCWLCGDPADTWDHVKPITRGGAHCLANMRPACRSCNSRKGNRWWPTAKAA